MVEMHERSPQRPNPRIIVMQRVEVLPFDNAILHHELFLHNGALYQFLLVFCLELGLRLGVFVLPEEDELVDKLTLE